MCPLRFILVFFSAVLAGYFAWKAVSPEEDHDKLEDYEKQQQFHFSKMVQKGFWMFIDMASGRYLWRNIKQLNQPQH